jgi:hypothetical protein
MLNAFFSVAILKFNRTKGNNMKRTGFYRSFVLLALFACSSCRAFLGDPYSDCCKIDLESLELKLSCNSNEGIERVESFDMVNSSESRLFLFDKKYDTFIQQVHIPIPNDSLVRKRRIIVKIWTGTSVIDDYRIYIEPSDWVRKKVVFATYNER